MQRSAVLALLLLAACAPPKGRHGYAHIEHLDFKIDRCSLDPVRTVFELSGDGTASIIRFSNETKLEVRPAGTRQNRVWFYTCVDETPLPLDAPAGRLRLWCRDGTAGLRVTVQFDCR